jgi:hypothetical protein
VHAGVVSTGRSVGLRDSGASSRWAAGIVHPLTFADSDPRSSLPAIVGAAVSSASIIAGFTFLAIGADLRVAENRALRGTTRQLVPTGWANAHGWGFGVAGRF